LSAATLTASATAPAPVCCCCALLVDRPSFDRISGSGVHLAQRARRDGRVSIPLVLEDQISGVRRDDPVLARQPHDFVFQLR
jgi:hypothetical protein